MFKFKQSTSQSHRLSDSKLFDERTFYAEFLRDVKRARKSVVIESPYITRRRFDFLLPDLAAAVNRGVRLIINTRNPDCHDEPMQQQATKCIAVLQDFGVTTLYTGNLHRKLAIIDGCILWEVSLNICSQSDSCEFMRRTVSCEQVNQLIRFTRLGKWYNV